MTDTSAVNKGVDRHMSTMSQEALEARRAYKREYAKAWRKRNAQKEKESQERYWERKAAELKQQAASELKHKAE